MATYRGSLPIRALATLASVGIVLLLLELYLRREVTYVVQREVTEEKLFEQTPEFLITVDNGHRRLLPNANVTIKNHFTSQRDVPIRTNSLGLRHRELSTQKVDRELRILVLGDSTTIMDYLPEEESYTRLVESELRATLSLPTIEVINAGVGNTGTEEQLTLFRDIAQQVQPDIVVIGYYLNDSRPPWGFSGEIGDYGWIRRHSLLASTLYRVFREWIWGAERRVQFEWIPAIESLDWRNDRQAFRELAQRARFDWGAAWQEEEQKRATATLRTLLTEIRQVGALPLAVIFPPRFQVESAVPDDTPQQWLTELFTSEKVPLLDLLPILRNTGNGELFFDHCHLTSEGSRIVAHALAPLLTATIRRE